MCDRIKEYEEKITKYEAELKDINEDIEYYNNKIQRYNKQLTVLEEEGNAEAIMSKVNVISMIYFDVAKKLTQKSTRIKCIQDCKNAIKSLTMN